MADRFVGRIDELAALLDAVASPPAIAVVDGEAGVGKSRLIGRMLADPVVADRVVLVGRCLMVPEPFPLSPVLDAIRAGAGSLPPPADLPPVVGGLATVLGDLGDQLPPRLEPLADRRAELHRVFVAATALLGSCGPTVLVLEDMHWADNQTWEFLAHLVTHQPPGLSVVLTVRDNAIDDLPIWEPLARAPAGPTHRIRLAPLPVTDVKRLAESMIGVESLPTRFAQSLQEKSAGIPFVVEEVLTALLQRLPPEEIARHPDPLRDLAVPTALRDVIVQRLMSLDPADREILGAAAVLGPSIDEQLLASVAGADPQQLARALSAALGVAILAEDGGRCQFRHVLAQQIVYEALPSPTRKWLHGRAAAALEGLPGTLRVAQLAHHYRQADNPGAFVRYAEAAADLAGSRGDDATAARFLLDIMSVPELEDGTRTRVAIRLGQSAVEGLAQTETVPVLESLLADGLLAAGERGQVRFLLGRLLRQQGQLLRGHQQIEDAVDDLGDRPDLQARALAILAVPDTVVGRHIVEHTSRIEQAEQAAARSADPGAGLAVRIARVSLWMETGDRRCWPAIDELRADLALASPREHARACLNWAQGALHVGQVTRAQTLLDEACRVVEDAGYLRVASVLDMVGTEVDRAAGRWEGLEGRIRLQTRAPAGFPAASLDSQFLLGTHLAGVGSADEAETLLRQVISTAESLGTVWPLIPAHAALSRLLNSTGSHARALEAALAGLEQVRAKGNWVWAAECVLGVLDACEELGGTETAREIVDEFADGLGDADAPIARATLEIALLSPLVLPDPAAWPEDRIGRIHALLDAAGSPYDRAAADERLGRWRCASGSERGSPGLDPAGGPLTADGNNGNDAEQTGRPDTDGPDTESSDPESSNTESSDTQGSDTDGSDTEGPALLTAALRRFGALGATRDVGRVIRTMRQVGVAVPYPWRGGRRTYGGQLSPREHQVATLAAAGRTNQEIAAELFLSRRTVETHIANALRKLGGSSRKELPALLDPADTASPPDTEGPTAAAGP